MTTNNEVLTLSLSPDPRGVHVAVHHGSECVHAEAMALPGMVGQGDTPRVDALTKQWEDDGATRGSAYAQLRDLARELERTATPTPPAGEWQEPSIREKNMAALILRLARALKRGGVCLQLPSQVEMHRQAVEALRRWGLLASPMRQTDAQRAKETT